MTQIKQMSLKVPELYFTFWNMAVSICKSAREIQTIRLKLFDQWSGDIFTVMVHSK